MDMGHDLSECVERVTFPNPMGGGTFRQAAAQGAFSQKDLFLSPAREPRENAVHLKQQKSLKCEL